MFPIMLCYLSPSHWKPSLGLEHGDFGGKNSTDTIFKGKIHNDGSASYFAVICSPASF